MSGRHFEILVETLRNGSVVMSDRPLTEEDASLSRFATDRAEVIVSCGASMVSLHPQIGGALWMVLLVLEGRPPLGLVDLSQSREARLLFVHGGDHMPESAQWGVSAQRAVEMVRLFWGRQVPLERVSPVSVYRASGPDVSLGGQALAERALGFGVVR